ncbi:DUF305 domain-containing protein [Roseococcus sp. DSY-14]|uniref:DUF305 domain-containing protein n=1 Tax=Roseococcus sp. DSY-14 TaxID=3369650 RepID=UPI00387B9938
MTHDPCRRLPALCAAALLLAFPARALEIESFDAAIGTVQTTLFVRQDAAVQRADRDYVASMRPHHAGALTMSRDYLANPGRSSPLLQQLSRAIVANQAFEIAVLDEVARNLSLPPVRLPLGVALQPVATANLQGSWRFFKTPIPAPPAWAVSPVSEEDVRFAKAMIIHHEAAVEMARAYHAEAAARNPFLHRMNTDIVTDQLQEIALMRLVIAAFPGDPGAVTVDPSMVHGMEGMSHGGHPPAPPAAAGRHEGHAAAAHHGHATPAAARPSPVRPPQRGPARAAHGHHPPARAHDHGAHRH